MPHPVLFGAAVLGLGVAALRAYRREQARVRELLDRISRQDAVATLPARRLERDPATGVYKLPDDRPAS